MRNVFILSFLLVSIGCSKYVELHGVERIEFGVIKQENLDENLKSQLGEILGLESRLEGEPDATLLTIKNPDESIVQAISLEGEDGYSSFYPVVENEVLRFEIRGLASELGSIVLHSYYVDGILIYDVTLDKETGIVLDYSVNRDALAQSSGRLDGCGFLCKGGQCVEEVLGFMGNGSAEGTLSAIACGVLWVECAAGVGLGCAVVALM